MREDFVPLGELPLEAQVQKLYELGEEAEAEAVANQLDSRKGGLESFWRPPAPYRHTQHQVGFIPPFDPGTEEKHKIISASHAPVAAELKNQRINVRLEFLRVYQYPRPFLNLGDNKHTILFTFEAQNQIPGGSEAVAFNQAYEAASGQDASVMGYPIFIGLGVGANGLVFSCKTVNIGNSNDEQLVAAINSDAAKTGLSLLTTAQPALAPFVGVATGLCTSLANRSKNAAVQKIDLGLDFETGAPGLRLGVGSYIVAQVPKANEITWSDWGFESASGTIVRTNLAEGEDAYTFPYNAIVFRISPFAGE